MANLDIYEREDLCGHVLRQGGRVPRRCSTACATSRSSATSAAPGFFHAIELVKDQDTKESFTHEESEHLLRGFLSGELYRRGLICRADDRGDPVIQLSPPLICDTEQFEEIEAVLRPVLTEAARAARAGALRTDSRTGRERADADRRLTGRGVRARACGRRPSTATTAVRWVHISEHEDPTPWLSGGELLLTTGYNLGTAAKQRRYVELLAGRGPRGARVRHRLRPQADPEGDPRDGGRSTTCRCSRSRTRCRSSRSPSAPRRGSSTSSSTCSSAAPRCTSASSGW